MPAGIVFHEADTLALGGLHDDTKGLTLCFTGLVEGCFDLLEVMTVDLCHLKTESLQLLGYP